MRKIWALCYHGPRNGDRDASTPQKAEDLPNSIWAFETRMGLSKLLEKDGTANNKYINKSDLMSILFSQ